MGVLIYGQYVLYCFSYLLNLVWYKATSMMYTAGIMITEITYRCSKAKYFNIDVV